MLKRIFQGRPGEEGQKKNEKGDYTVSKGLRSHGLSQSGEGHNFHIVKEDQTLC